MSVQKPISRRLNFQDLTGVTFTFLTVIGIGERRNGSLFWRCKCKCGKETLVYTTKLKSGHTKSCGCYSHNLRVEQSTKHGCAGRQRQTATYKAWCRMITRCSSSDERRRRYYGGRGITVCERWKSFDSFLADMGECPSPRHSPDRFPDNDGNYEPGNVRWATQKQQCNNHRRNRLLVVRGETKTVSEWADVVGVSAKTIFVRLAKGHSEEMAVLGVLDSNRRLVLT